MVKANKKLLKKKSVLNKQGEKREFIESFWGKMKSYNNKTFFFCGLYQKNNKTLCDETGKIAMDQKK